jgi:hypothetical protein
MRILDCFIKQSRLWFPTRCARELCGSVIKKLAFSMRTCVRSMWYMAICIAACELGGSLYYFSLFESIFLLFESICSFYKTSLLAWNCFQFFFFGRGLTIAFYGRASLNKTHHPIPWPNTHDPYAQKQIRYHYVRIPGRQARKGF